MDSELVKQIKYLEDKAQVLDKIVNYINRQYCNNENIDSQKILRYYIKNDSNLDV